MAELLSHGELNPEIPATRPVCEIPAGTMGPVKTGVSGALESTCLSDFDNSPWIRILLTTRSVCVQDLKVAGRRFSESRMRKNLMSGSIWQGMKTKIWGWY
jgi:hypothetical protein